MAVMKSIQGSLITVAAVLQPVAASGNRSATKACPGDDVSVFISGLEHTRSLEPCTNLNDFFLGHNIAQEILHGSNIIDSQQGLN